MFYIKKIVITGSRVEPASIDFEPGLNIVYGESNTGKSYVADCIDYMFGAKEIRISPDTGYEKITMSIVVNGITMTMEREIGSNDIEVSGAPYPIENGTYKRKNAKMVIGDVWLKLMGIPDGQKVISNANYKPSALTLLSFRHLFYINENNVDKESSIILPDRGYNETAAKTALLYLMTGNNYLDEHQYVDPKIQRGKKEALAVFVDRRLRALGDRQKELTENTPNLTPSQLEEKISDTLTEIESTEGNLSQAVERSKELATRIYELNESLAENKVLLNRYDALMSQYKSDIKRLNFIAEGDAHGEGLPEMVRCPFCNGEIEKAKEESCAAAAYAEVERILPQISDLQEAREELQSEYDEEQSEKAAITEERAALQEAIKSDMRPRLKTLRENLAEYTFSLQNYSERSVIKRIAEDLQREYEEYTEEELADEATFNLNAHFDQSIREKLMEIYSSLLRDLQFDPFNVASFDLDTYDVTIDGHPKKSYGQGYRAFLNVIMAITIQSYLEQYGTYSPKLLIIDSPILSLKERADEIKTSQGMKASLFKYFTDNQETRQTIIIENKVPDTVSYDNVNRIHFTKDENDGRYGLLNGIK
ncbi:MAG: hypothetical protein IJH43_03295 [Mogibacterium sp.]|nr:hypothetical protein [Mogibacterium sp.]